jgi:tRNA G18 (ribose-2'-O)-methylase SpoU
MLIEIRYNITILNSLHFFSSNNIAQMRQLRPKEAKKFLKKRFSHKYEIEILLDNVQYARNVAEFFRIADAAGVKALAMHGITPTPPFGNDLQKVSRKKEFRVKWEKIASLDKYFNKKIKEGYEILALELTDESINIAEADKLGPKIVLICGNEVNGISKEVLKYASKSIMIPMYGKGASLNVSVSAAVSIYYLLLQDK